MTHSRIKLTKYSFQSHQTHKMGPVGGSMIARLPQMDLVTVDVRGGQIQPDVERDLVGCDTSTAQSPPARCLSKFCHGQA